jgi:hypothetical protein
MLDDTHESGAAVSNDPSSPRKARFITAVVIALAIGSVAFIVQSGASRAERVDYATAGVANLASSVPTGATDAGAGSMVGSATASRFQRSDEPAYTDSMNPHGG